MDNNYKIIHCADIHLGSKLETSLTKAKAKVRRQEVFSSFTRMVKYAVDNRINIILIAGDLFDFENTSEDIKKVFDVISTNEEINFYYVKGNHDENPSLENKPNNLYTFSSELTSYRINDLVISGIEQDNVEFYNNLKLNKDDFNILLLHANVISGNSSKAEDIDLKSLKDKNIDYLALGHIHSFNKYEIDSRGLACYSGCLEGRGYDECGEKGFVVLEINDKKIKNLQFICNSERQLLTVEIDITGVIDVFNYVLDKVKDINRNYMVKVILVGDYTVDTIKDVPSIEMKLKDEFFSSKVYDESKFKVDYNTYINDVSLKGEFVRMVANDTSLTEEEKEKINYYGIKALCKEEIK